MNRSTMPKQRDTTKRGRGRSATTGAASRGRPGRKRRPDTLAERSDSSRRGRKPGRGPNPAIRQAEAESEGPPPQVSSSAASSQPNEAPVAGEQLEQGVPGEFFVLFLAWPIPSGHDSPTGGGKRAIDPHLVGPLPIAQPDVITQSSPMLLGEVAGHAGREVPMEIVQPRAITENCRYAHKCQRCNDPMHKASSCPN